MRERKKENRIQRTEHREQKKKNGLVFVISGPSGSGKSTLLKKLFFPSDLKGLIHKPVSFTTRPKRLGEIDGRDYFFISEAAFKRKLKEKKILEWIKYLGYYYGTPYEIIEKQIRKGRHLVLCLDLKGARRIKKLYSPNVVSCFILPPSLRALDRRIRNRCHKTCLKEIKARLKLAKQEVAFAGSYDYRLVNNKLKGTLEKLKSIVIREISRHKKEGG